MIYNYRIILLFKLRRFVLEKIKISGIWKIENLEFKGELHIIKEKKIIRLLLQENTSKTFFEEDFPEKMDLIIGNSFLDNVNITLLNCKTLRKNLNFSTGITTYLIDCKYCIYGLKFNNIDDVTFNKLQIRLTNSMEWSMLSGFSAKIGTKRKIEEIGYSFKKKVTYNVNDNIKLEIVPYFGGGSYHLNSEKIILNQHVKINFICKKLENFNNIIEELNKLIALIEFSTKQKVDIIEIKGFKNSKFYKIPDIKKRQYISYRIYFSKEVDIKNEDVDINKRDRHFTCNLKQICDVNELAHWYNKYEDLKPIIDSYRKNIENFEYFNELPEEEIFINLTKSLEFYHTRFIAESLKEYNKIISNKLKNALSENKELIQNFIYDDIQKKEDYILLKNRLFHLLLENMPISYFGNFMNIINFTNSVVDTRHYYTHYNKSKQSKAMKGFELSVSNILLQTILECFILKELGFTNEFIDKHQKSSWTQLKKYEIPPKEVKYIEKYQDVGITTSIENILKIVVNEYNLGELLNYNVEDCHDDGDLYIKINTERNKEYKIRVLSKIKNDECCDAIVKNDKNKLIYTKRNFYCVYYFYEKYRILIYKK